MLFLNKMTGVNNKLADQEMLNSLESVINGLSNIKQHITVVQKNMKIIEKKIQKELKLIKKIDNNKLKKQLKQPSGFAKPVKVTEELCIFMNRPNGTEIARTEVTKALIKYIEINNLKDKDVKKNIIPDSTLKNLLGISHEEISGLNFFNIQKYMNKHFISNKNIVIENTINSDQNNI